MFGGVTGGFATLNKSVTWGRKKIKLNKKKKTPGVYIKKRRGIFLFSGAVYPPHPTSTLKTFSSGKLYVEALY